MENKEFFDKMKNIKTASELYEFVYCENDNDNLSDNFEKALESLDLSLYNDDEFLTDFVPFLVENREFSELKELLSNYKGNTMVLIDDSQDYDQMLNYDISDYIDDIVNAMENN